MCILGRLILGALAVIGLTCAVLALAPRVQASVAVHQVHSKLPATRKKALSHIRDERQVSAVPELIECVRHESEPALIELAAYALMRTRDRAGLPVLQARADAEPDSFLKAKLILYASRLADGDYRLLAWLQEGAADALPWRRAASCVGLLQLGRLEGGDSLLSPSRTLPPEPRDFALQEFSRVAEPMAEAAGRPLHSSAEVDLPAETQWGRIATFWQTLATRELLSESLQRLEHQDPKWREVDRLLHARQRVTRWIH